MNEVSLYFRQKNSLKTKQNKKLCADPFRKKMLPMVMFVYLFRLWKHDHYSYSSLNIISEKKPRKNFWKNVVSWESKSTVTHLGFVSHTNAYFSQRLCRLSHPNNHFLVAYTQKTTVSPTGLCLSINSCLRSSSWVEEERGHPESLHLGFVGWKHVPLHH